jgi:transposase
LSTPLPKPARARGLSTDTASSTLSEILKVQDADSDELYEAVEALSERQQEIEQSLAVKLLWEGSLILTRCDFHLFWGTCPLAQDGYSRDNKKGKLQIIFGLLCNAAAWTIAVEVFEGNINDAKTLSPVLEKVSRWGLNG